MSSAVPIEPSREAVDSVAAEGELRPLFRLAWPVIIAELGWMGMGLVDTAMVGRVSAEAIGAVAVGTHTFFVAAMFGIGLLLGLDPLVSQAWGAGRTEDAHRGLVHGVYVSLGLGVLSMAVLWWVSARLSWFGVDAAVLPDAIGYLDAVTWGLVPLLLFATLRRYLQGTGIVRPVMVIVLVANVVNALANWVLIFGHLGFPAMGARGSAWATTLARVFMLGAVVAYAVAHDRRRAGGGFLRVSWRIEARLLDKLLRLGLPAAVQVTLEGGVFTAATLLAARLDPTALAAHQIALGAAAFAFMVPLGVSSAGAVRVGQKLGGRDPEGARRAGWTALLLGGGFMSLSAISFLVVPHAILRIFTSEASVIEVGTGLLAIAAAFQLFDGVQVVATGALRGSGDTRTSMLTSLVGYWLVSLPLGAFLCFSLGLGVYGLWAGLTFGLVFAAIALVWAWSRRTRRLPELAAVA
ncbi:MAG: MATE family efflux transporter [Deltaproteobacteria bacterium]|nr:MATE family efflux transporter [Deltaproteobacteria bacterium]